MRRASGLVLVLAAALGAAAAGPPRDAPFTLGVLRRDGILLPFAAFNGRDWRSPWPATGADVALPIALRDVPTKWWGEAGAQAPWTSWIIGEGTLTPHPLALRKPAVLRVFCGERLGIDTDYRGGAVDLREPTVPKHGLAIASAAGAVTLQPVHDVSVLSPDAKRMIETIRDDFNDQEARAARRFTRWYHPYNDHERQQYPIQLEAFYRARDATARGAWTTSYVEAVRRFPPEPEDKDCGLITFVRGWVIEREGREPVINIGARVTYCDRADVSFMLPFGQLLVGGESYWVYQLSSWRDEFYSVARVRPEDVRPVVAVAGGGC